MEKEECPNPEISHDTQYRRVYRHLDFFINKALENNDSLFTIEEIRKKLFEETSFRFHMGTLKKYLKKCLDKYGEAPLEELCILNPEYYEKRKVKPPRNYFTPE